MNDELSLTINVGPIKYYLGDGPSVELLYNNRNEYIKAFGNNEDTERILRTYMGHVKSKFKNNDKQKLIDILQKRVNTLKTSNEITSSYLKNMKFKRSYIEIQKIIDEIKSTTNEENEVNEEKGIKGESLLNRIIPSRRNKKYINSLTDDKKYFLILKLSWMLLNDTNTSWASLIKELDNISLNGFLTTYADFKKPTDKESMKKYVVDLMKILKIKKFLNKNPKDESDTKDESDPKDKSDMTDFEKNSKNIIFSFFEKEYNSVYSFLTKIIDSYNKPININALFALYKKMNSIYTSKEYGVYNVPNDNLDFINYILASLKKYINDDNFKNFITLPKIQANNLQHMENIKMDNINDSKDLKKSDMIFVSSLTDLLNINDDLNGFFNKNSLYILYDKIQPIENIKLYNINDKLYKESYDRNYVIKLGANGQFFNDSLISFIIFIVYNRDNNV